jgi:phosphoribosylamine--glycine ligase
MRVPEVQVFHSGSKSVNGQPVTAGGRVLGATAAGSNLQEALDRAYQALAEVHFEGMYYRRDIGRRALQRRPS